MARELISHFTSQSIEWLARNKIRVQVFGAFTFILLAAWLVVGVSLYFVKKNFRDNYYTNLEQRLNLIRGILTSPAGETSLQNAVDKNAAPFSPYVLNVSALDVQNPRKAFDIAAQSGCLVSYGGRAELCAAFGNQPIAGAYLYIVGWVEANQILPHVPGSPIDSAHNIRIRTKVRSTEQNWVVVFQEDPHAKRLKAKPLTETDYYATGYRLESGLTLTNIGRDSKDLRGRLNYSSLTQPCPARASCVPRWQFAIKLPIDAFRDDLASVNTTWPPKDFKSLAVDFTFLPPGPEAQASVQPLIESTSLEATRKYSLESELSPRFSPWERVRIFKAGDNSHILWQSRTAGDVSSSDLSTRLGSSALSLLPIRFVKGHKEYKRRIEGRFGNYDLTVEPSEEIADSYMRPLASQLMFLLAGILIVIGAAWIYIRDRVVQRIRRLTSLADDLSSKLKGGDADTIDSEFYDLQGADELGILARGIHELLGRVNDNLRRRRTSLDRLQKLWSAIAHEIVSPLQSLASVHPEGSTDRSRQYITRMERAVRVLSTAGSLETANWDVPLKPLNVTDFLQQLQSNAKEVPHLPDIQFRNVGDAIWVQADDASLDTVLGHVLTNAKRYISENGVVNIRLDMPSPSEVNVGIYNDGPHISEDLIEKIFDLGVSGREGQQDLFSHGQGLFMASLLMASMGGRISVRNVDPIGVEFSLVLQRASLQSGS